MAVRYGQDETGGFPYAEIDFSHKGKDYVVRLTAFPPYRNADNTLNAHINFHNLSDDISGRYENVQVSAPTAGETRRHPVLRDFQYLLANGTQVVSPIFP